jgi:hypothetical protein
LAVRVRLNYQIMKIGNSGRAMRAPTISVINQFKGYATKQIWFSLWQKLIFEHIIQDKPGKMEAQRKTERGSKGEASTRRGG